MKFSILEKIARKLHRYVPVEKILIQNNQIGFDTTWVTISDIVGQFYEQSLKHELPIVNDVVSHTIVHDIKDIDLWQIVINNKTSFIALLGKHCSSPCKSSKGAIRSLKNTLVKKALS